ncbi:MAG: MBOAT family protein [Lachnospiraceae bacterium]|nr:MBOAT family protein [Lachnospiraceae bacterium]
MLFNSYIFVFLFFPICLFGYYGLLHAHRTAAAKVFLIAMSFWFYGWFNVSYLLIMVGSIGGNYLFHRMLSNRADRVRTAFWRKAVMIMAVALNLGLLFYFKYFDFFLSTMNSLFGTSAALRHILLPLGISFFTFQQISFIVDTYRGEVQNCSLTDYALFVSFFPQLIAGPIVNHSEMLPQFARMGKENVEWQRIAEGMGLFILGLAKKVLIADTFGGGVDYGYTHVEFIGRADAVLIIVFYALQLYLDFSGYCDMARGIGKMLGIEIPVNFDSPYQAVNIVDFWKRWHITLNRFFTKYVYIPLGGNRKGQVRMYCNLFAVFMLSGLWHGAGWNYLVWGAMHGALYVLTRFWFRNIKPCLFRQNAGMPSQQAVVQDTQMPTAKSENGRVSQIGHGIMTLVSRILLFIYVAVAWVYFRAENIAQANRMLATAVSGTVQKVSSELAECFRVDEFWYVIKVLHLDNMSYSRYILMWVILAAGLYLALIGRNAAQRMEKMKYRTGSAVVFAVLALWCVLTFSKVSTFLYFNF